MLSLCITTYNRFEMTTLSFRRLLNDSRISEIVIVDDCSNIEHYDKLAADTLDIPKVRLFRNEKNLGMSLNKKRSVELAKNDWVILFDSDNSIGPDYLNALGPIEFLRPNVIYCPSFAMPKFDYRCHNGEFLSGNCYYGRDTPQIDMCLNTCNFVVNRHEYLKVYEHNPEMKGTDTIWFNYLWLKAGNHLLIVPGMEYEHRVHDGSGWLQDADYNMKQGKKIKELIKQL